MIETAQHIYPVQTSIFDSLDNNTKVNVDLTSTFIDNMKLPIHRWFRYSAGFSAKWVEKTIRETLSHMSCITADNSAFIVLDPFVGSGTTLLAAEQVGVQGIGFESHALIAKVASAKLLWNTDINSFREFADSVLLSAEKTSKKLDFYPSIVNCCYDEENLKMIDCLKYVLNSTDGQDSNEYKLSWLAFLSILRATSHAGTAQWQYILPNKSKVKVLNVFDAYSKQINLMCGDIAQIQSLSLKTHGVVIQHDARKPFDKLANTVDLIITSPPYANNYDYADATRLELCVLGEIKGWCDLQNAVRSSLVRSCSQQVSKEKNQTYEFLDNPVLASIRDEIYSVCKRLDGEKDLHGGKKNYHTMIALYFFDLAHVFLNLRKLCKENADVCFVIGDSAPYGIYVPVDQWLGKLALAAGFKSFEFVKTRDRNIKWKNRKHRVPLKEGQLWIKG
jgi:hypothetical protein